jgi:hypothetical protein
MEAKRTVDGPAGTAIPRPFQKAGLNGYDGSFWPLGTSIRRRQFISLLGGAAVRRPGRWPRGRNRRRLPWSDFSTLVRLR